MSAFVSDLPMILKPSTMLDIRGEYVFLPSGEVREYIGMQIYKV